MSASSLASNSSIIVMESYQQLLTSLTPSIRTLTLLLSSVSTASDRINAESRAELDRALQHLSESTELFILAQSPNANDGFNISDIQNTLRAFESYSDNITELSNGLRDRIINLGLEIEIFLENLTEYAIEILTLVEDDSMYRSQALAVFNTSKEARDRGVQLVATLNSTLITVTDFNTSSNIAQRQAMESLEKVGLIKELSMQAENNVTKVRFNY